MQQIRPSSSCAIPSGKNARFHPVKRSSQSANGFLGVSTDYRLLCSADILTASPEFPNCNLDDAPIPHKIKDRSLMARFVLLPHSHTSQWEGSHAKRTY